MDILRFITAGNVDDGKSTLIGRLLYDSKNVKEDTLLAVSYKNDAINLAYLTDGLRQERERGITIDIAYKYFYTKTRKYIISDAPGHFQYTRNLVTGASSADAMIVLIDAKNGITAQTKRHSMVAKFLKIQGIIVAINKMDTVEYSESKFNNIKNEFLQLVSKLGFEPKCFVPISALKGDNVFEPSENMSWYSGPTLMDCLEKSEPFVASSNLRRFSVQYVKDNAAFGRVISGHFKLHDTVIAYPQGNHLVVSNIINDGTEVEMASSGDNACLSLTPVNNARLIVSRGDIIAYPFAPPNCTNTIIASLCWLDERYDAVLGKTYILRVGTKEVECTIKAILRKFDMEAIEWQNFSGDLQVNDFAQVVIETSSAIAVDSHLQIPLNGRGILINMETNSTVGAFTITE